MDCTCQSSLSMGFTRQEYWSGLPYPPPGNLPNQGIKPRSPILQVGSILSEPPRKYGLQSLKYFLFDFLQQKFAELL